VCDIENMDMMRNAKSIRQIQPGKVYLNNGKWYIKEKVKIKFV